MEGEPDRMKMEDVDRSSLDKDACVVCLTKVIVDTQVYDNIRD